MGGSFRLHGAEGVKNQTHFIFSDLKSDSEVFGNIRIVSAGPFTRYYRIIQREHVKAKRLLIHFLTLSTCFTCDLRWLMSGVCMKAPTPRRLKEHYVEIKLSSREGTSSTSRDCWGSEIKILLNVCLRRVMCARVCVACLKRCWILTLTRREPFFLARSPQNYLCARREVLS